MLFQNYLFRSRVHDHTRCINTNQSDRRPGSNPKSVNLSHLGQNSKFVFDIELYFFPLYLDSVVTTFPDSV